MDAQQETSRVLDLKQLDLILSFVPNPDGAKVLRAQFVSACRIVEKREDEVAALNDKAEAQSNRLQVQLEELKNEREALREQKDQEIEKLRNEQVKLENLARTLGSQFQDLETNVGQVSDNVNSCKAVVADGLEDFGKIISDRTSEREQAVNLLNQDIKELSASAKKNTDHLSSMADKSDAIATAMDSVKEDQKRIESCLRDGVTMEGIRNHIGPLIAIANTIKQGIDGLPTVASLDTKFADVGRLADRLEHFRTQAMQLDQDNQELKQQAQLLETETAHQVVQANSRAEHASSMAEEARSQLQEKEDSIRQKDSSISELQTANADLQNRLTQADSQGDAAKRRLEDVEAILQTAEANRQELAEAVTKLQQAEQTAREMRQKVTNLQGTLNREKELHDACSVKLTKALSNNGDILLQKAKMENECAEVRNDLAHLRSQKASDLQRQLKDQWAAVSEAMKEQLSDKRSHQDTIRQLNASWDSEKKALQSQISDKDSLIESHKEQLQTLQSRVSILEPLQEQLTTAKGNINRVEEALETANSNLRLSQQRLAKSEEMVRDSGKELADVKAENGRLREAGESVSQQLRTSNGTIERLQKECNAARHTLSTLQAQSVRLPEGTTGELSKIYYRAADELRNIPMIHNADDELELSQVAAELITLMDGFESTDNLLDFLHSDSKGWYCLRQVINGNLHPVGDGGNCRYHDDCLSVKVVEWQESPALKFFRGQ